MKPKEHKCPYCEDSGVIVRHNNFHGTMFINCPYCEEKRGITPVQLASIITLTFVLAWSIAIITTIMFG